MSNEFSHPGDDTVFVRRCRIVAVAAVRVVAIYLVLRGLEGLFGAILTMARSPSFGAGPSLSLFTALLVLAPVVSGFVLWYCARWLAARLLPMPPARTQCPKCKYPIGEIEGDTCPECGSRVR